MPSVVLLVPGPLDALTGGSGYDRRILAGLRRLGWEAGVRELDSAFPLPTPVALAGASRALAEIPDGSIVLVDGLALGAMPETAERLAPRMRIVALVHHPLALETGLDRATSARLEASERRALAAVGPVVVTSRATAVRLASYGVAPERVTVVEPGTDAAPLARGSGGPHTQLLCVASLTPRKGHDVLFRALARLKSRAWRLACLGSVDRDPAGVARLVRLLHEEGLNDRVMLAGEAQPEVVARHADASDLFVLPTLYEGYGMAVAEALARGLPVISTPTGAIADLVGGEAGVLLPVGDVDALAAAIARFIDDPAERTRFAEGARRVRDRLPDWDEAAVRMAQVLEQAAHGHVQR